jgi:uncharacterized membrane protein
MPKSRASINGHPMHPALVAVPIGLLTGTVLADVAFAISHNPTCVQLSFWTAIGGILATIPAATTGLIDYSGIADARVKRVGITHMILNSIAIVLFALGTFLLYAKDGNLTDARFNIVLPLQLIAFAVMGMSGYLGGEMVFKDKMGVVES